MTFGYGEKPVLSDFSMTVKQGGQVTLVGRTGAGKSTVFKLLLGLYQPQAGSVTIGGVDVARITDRERRTCIGCVEQHFSRVPGTVLEQITLGDPQITAEMARNAAKLAGIDEAIQALPEGCDTVCSDGMFSQGEWQLLSIARAAAADPAVLLLDDGKAKPGCEAVQPQDAQRVLGEPLAGHTHRPYDAALQVGLPAKGVHKALFFIVGHGVDGKIPPGQILPHIRHKVHLVRVAAICVGAFCTEGGDLVKGTALLHRYRAVLQAGGNAFFCAEQLQISA